MAARLAKADVQPPDRDRIEARYAQEGLQPYAWANGPRDRYGWHSHGYTKVLYCVTGSIVFHTRDGDFTLEPGDRLEVDPGSTTTPSAHERAITTAGTDQRPQSCAAPLTGQCAFQAAAA